MAMMDVQAVPLAAAWASQTVGMEPPDELDVAGGLVHQVGDGEIHCFAPPAERPNDLHFNPGRSGKYRHQLPDMTGKSLRLGC
jgi:hypothetical protein